MIPSLKSIRLIKPFTHEIEQELFKQARDIDVFNGLMDKDCRVPNPHRDTLIHQVIPFAGFIVRKYRRHSRGAKYDDYMSLAYETCVSCYYKFDETLQWRWTSYVGGSIFRNLQKFDEYDKVIRTSKPVKITNELYAANPILSETDTLDDDLKQLVHDCLDCLSDVRGKEILLRRQNETLKAIGVTLGLTRERVRQIESKSLCEFENALRERGIDHDFY